MADTYTVIVNNESIYSQDLYFFQEPARYSGGRKVYTNSLGHVKIAPKPQRGDIQAQFVMELQRYAGVQTLSHPIVVGQANIGDIVDMPIDVCSSGHEADSTLMLIENGLSLSIPANGLDVERGAFRIKTPSFNPLNTAYIAGVATKSQGELVLSSYVIAEPNKNIDVQPVTIFYVATGSYTAGMTVNFDTSSVHAAVCDATYGQELFFVTYTSFGKWVVSGTPPVHN